VEALLRQARELDPLLEQAQRRLERQIPSLELLNDLPETADGLLEAGLLRLGLIDDVERTGLRVAHGAGDFAEGRENARVAKARRSASATRSSMGLPSRARWASSRTSASASRRAARRRVARRCGSLRRASASTIANRTVPSASNA